MSQDKKKKRNQSGPRNQKASGLVNANHFYETAEELANRHLQQHKQQQQEQAQQGQSQGQSPQQKQQSQNPENPQQN